MAELSDQMLIARATVFGNRRAFDTLVRRYQSPLRRFLMNLTGGDNTLSDDLAPSVSHSRLATSRLRVSSL